MEVLKKYFINKKVKTLTVLIDIILAVLYIGIIFIVNNASQIKGLENNSIAYQIVDMFGQIILIAFSIITTTFLTSWLIEVKDKNNIYRDAICKDFLCSQEFYEAIDDDKKREMLHYFEKCYYFEGCEKKEEMYSSITNKLEESDRIYYDSCKYDVDCEIDGNLIRKHITRTTKLFSTVADTQINDLHLISSQYGTVDGVKSFELKSVEINGESIDIENQLNKEKMPTKDQSLQKCGYNESIKYSYKGKLKIRKQLSNSDRENLGTTIKIKYDTIVSKNDTSYVCRVKYPCKHFSLNFRIGGKQATDYEVSAHSFGFIDEGNNSGNKDNRQVANIEFANWIFESDGVAVVISRKN